MMIAAMLVAISVKSTKREAAAQGIRRVCSEAHWPNAGNLEPLTAVVRIE